SCAAGLVDRAEGRRLALPVDDGHLLDDMSATLVHQLTATTVPPRQNGAVTRPCSAFPGGEAQEGSEAVGAESDEEAVRFGFGVGVEESFQFASAGGVGGG